MPIAERIKLYKAIEDERKRPLIVYVTSGRMTPRGSIGEMESSAISELGDQLEAITTGPDGIDFLVVSDGGDAMVAWRAITMLRERTEKIAILVPQSAYSAATLLALGANEIVMHKNGNLGPVDPQISVRKSGETEGASFGYQDMIGFLEFAREEVKLNDQEHARAIFEMFCKQVGPVPVGIAARSVSENYSIHKALLFQYLQPRILQITK